MTTGKLFPVWLAIIVLLLSVGVRAHASTSRKPVSQRTLPTRVAPSGAVADTTIGKVITVYIYQPGLGNNRTSEFFTDGQRVAGLTAAELNKKFSKNVSTVRVLNFLIANGYRVIGFAYARYGYNYLLEKVR